MRERKKTGLHGTLHMLLMAWKFNSKQLLSKTLNSRMNIIETRAVLNIIKKSESEMEMCERKKIRNVRKDVPLPLIEI